jgi:AraC-like DNA-binding protein
VAPAVARLRQAAPRLPVIVRTGLAPADVRELVAAVRAGATDVLVGAADDDRATLRAALDRASHAVAADLIVAAAGPLVPPAARHFLAACAAHADATLTVEGAAALLGLSRRTLVNRLAHDGLPGPRQLIARLRLLHAAWRLDDPSASLERAALELDFPSAAALHNLFRRQFGLGAGEVRRRGGFAFLLARFVEMLRPTADATRRAG